MQNFKFIFCIVFCLSLQTGQAQGTLPTSMQALEDYYRRAQLLGEFDSTVSFMLKPLYSQNFDTSAYAPFQQKAALRIKKGNWFQAELLPVLSKSVYNHKQPYGWNNGSIRPASGYQQMTSLGFAAKIGPLKIQMYPEFLYAQNRDYDGFPLTAPPVVWNRLYRNHFNRIDTPERFGEEPIEEVLWGQSFAKLEFGPVSLGISNENIYWGPGRRNSLIMSNNARGFKHLTVHSNKPVKSPIGWFEFQFLGGKLENSGFLPPNAFSTFNGRFNYRPKKDEWRYLAGMSVNYMPKWLPRLSLGFNRVFQIYNDEIDGDLGLILPFFDQVSKRGQQVEENLRRRDQLISLTMRYFWPKNRTEVYAEFAKNDHNATFRDFFLEPGHAAAFLFGFTKLFPFKRKVDEFIEANLEWTIGQQSANRIIRNAKTFYIHGQIRQGYTHNGEILGAGIGPGSNAQTLNVRWVKGIQTLGLQLERYVHNNDLYIDLFTDIQDPRRHWIDVSAFLKGSWQWDRLIVNGEAGIIQSLNYQYQIIDQLRTGEFFVPGIDVLNFSARLDLILLF